MKKSLLILLFLSTWLNYAQDHGIHEGQLNSPIPENFFSASPDVTAFQKYNTLPVNLYTGKINLSVPIFEITSGNISVPISISYNSGGIKVDDIASSVGLGWNLNAGGNIVRSVKDIPDNEVGYSLFSEADDDLGAVFNPILSSYGYNRKGAVPYQNHLTWGATNKHAIYTESPTSTSTSTTFGTFGTSKAVQDMSPDEFMVRAPGFSSKFISVNTSSQVIYPNNSNGFTTTFLDNSGAKMTSLLVDRRAIDGYGFTPSSSVTTTHFGRTVHPIKDFFEFTIRNTNGLEYSFAEEEVSESFYSPLGEYLVDNTWKTLLSNNYTKRIHTWNLSTIEDIVNNKNVTFNYDTYGNDNVVGNTFVNDHALVQSGPSTLSDTNKCVFKHNTFGIGRTAPNGYTGAYGSSEKHPQRKRLTSITFDQGEVVFLYNHIRQDLIGEKALTEIQVKNVSGDVIRRIRFNYSYLISKENCTDAECKRLRLDSVDMVASDGEINSYNFDYDNTNPLPKRGSLEQDYLGYYNNNSVTGVSNATTSITPTLFFYPNQGKNSILPFQRTNETNVQVIPGQIDFTPNSYGLSGLLTKVTYPTGGSSEFEYENHSFNFMGAEYTGPGARIKSQKLITEDGIAKEYHYDYEETDGSNSGYINSVPVYGYLYRFQRSPFSAYEVAVYDKPKGGLEMTSGSFIGYSRVIESSPNNGYTEYEYVSPETDPNIPEARVATNGSTTWPTPNSLDCSSKFINNNAYPSMAFINNDYKRGKVKRKDIYSEASTLLSSEVRTYTSRNISTISTGREFKIQAEEVSSAFDSSDEGKQHILDVSSSLSVVQDLQTQVNITQYFDGQAVTNQTTTSYDANLPLVKQITTTVDGEQHDMLFYYPFDTEVSGLAHMSDLVNENRISGAVRQEAKRDGELIVTKEYEFENYSSGIISLKSQKTAKANKPLEALSFIDELDDKGNIKEYHSSNNVSSIILWGYNKTLPIAKIENASYASLTPEQSAAITSVINASDTDTTVNAENNLRNAYVALQDAFDNSMITGYTYDPLIGITSIIDSKGYITYYEYDTFNRLQYVKDHEKNILKANDYHYKVSGTGVAGEPTISENYIKTTNYLKPTFDGVVVNIDDKIETITYFDGIGREKQHITPRGGGSELDIVQPMIYDAQGRQSKEYLPYVNSSQPFGSSSLAYQNNTGVIGAISGYYQAKYPDDLASGSINPYSEKVFEASPLNRVLEQGAPGSDWIVNTTSDTDHTIKMEYKTNTYISGSTTADNVRKFSVTHSTGIESITLSDDGYYPQASLYKVITKDENWQPTDVHNHTTEEYKNKLGQVVLQRAYNNGDRHDTYYVYDKYGNLTYVLPPKAMDASDISLVLDGLCYQYKYDYRNRVIEKKSPGIGWKSIIYDNSNRAILVQDAKQEVQTPYKEWIFTKYDVFGRAIYTGLYHSNDSRIALQNSLTTYYTNHPERMNEERTATATTVNMQTSNVDIYYSVDSSFPLTIKEIYAINYYDDYDWDTGTSYEASYDLSDVNGLNHEGISYTKNLPNNWGDSGFKTESQIIGDGYIQFTATRTDKRVMVGLSNPLTGINDHYNTIGYAIYLHNNGRVYVYNNGTSVAIPVPYYQVGDTFKVERTGNTILFKQNDTTFYAMPVGSNEPLIGDAAFCDLFAKIENVFIGYSTMGQAFGSNSKTLSTGTKVRTLGSSTWTTSVNYFDIKGRNIKSFSKNDYLGTIDAISSKLDFAGKIIKTYSTHKKGTDNPIVTEEEFYYDHMGRLLRQTQEINSSWTQLISKNNYDDIGQLYKKQVGGKLPKTSTYENPTDVTVLSGLMTKTGATNGWNAGLTTEDSFSGDGYVRFTPLQTNDPLMVGLNDTNSTSADHADIEYKIYLRSNGVVGIYELASNRGDKTTYVPGDKFAIERRGQRVVYLKNGEVFYTSETPATASEYYGDISIWRADSEPQLKDFIIVDLEKELQEVDYTYNIRGWLKGINDINAPSNDLFSFAIKYNDIADPSKKLFNGNISSTLWRTKNTDSSIKSYVYDYDHLNRITSALDNTGNYNLNLVNYDKNGNITDLHRSGHLDESATLFGNTMDILSYTYNSGNQLSKVTDAGNTLYGFKDGTNTDDDYGYDINGNLVFDKNKDITNIHYNHLNLPTEVTFGSGNIIMYVYDASGIKLRKRVTQGKSTVFTDYSGNYVYKGNDSNNLNLEFINQPEGYIEPIITNDRHGVPVISDLDYIFQYKDHLGNIRLSYHDYNDDGIVTIDEIKEENHYYPFGMKMKGFNETIIGAQNKLLTYNGKEWEDSLGFNMYEMDVRQFDPSIARWYSIDPVTHHSYSPYNVFDNNPVFFADPSGADAMVSIDMQNGGYFSMNSSGGFSYGGTQATQTQSTDKGSGEYYKSFFAMKAKMADDYLELLKSIDVLSDTSFSESIANNLLVGALAGQGSLQPGGLNYTITKKGWINLNTISKYLSLSSAFWGAIDIRYASGTYITTGGVEKPIFSASGAPRSLRASGYAVRHQLIRGGSYFFAGVGVAIDGMGLYNYFYSNDPDAFKTSPGRFVLNTTFTIIGLYGGPVGWVFSGFYFGMTYLYDAGYIPKRDPIKWAESYGERE